MKKQEILRAGLCVLLMLATGVANAQLINENDKLLGFVAARCPSEIELDPGAPAVPRGGFGASDLLGLGIDYVFDKLGDALAKAAEMDKNGRATSATVPGYLYRIKIPATKDDLGTFQAPGCVVIALADSEPTRWCDGPPLKSAAACSGNSTLNSLFTPVLGVTPLAGISTPHFYAEILLIPSNDSSGLLPKLMALYYPAGLHDSGKFRGKKPRDLSITASAASPGGQGALSSVNVILKELLPEQTLLVRPVSRDKNGDLVSIGAEAKLDKSIAEVWQAVVKAPEKAAGTVGAGAVPVNLSLEVREIGDPNLFLQFLASAFAKNKDSLAAETKSKYIPSVAAAEAATDKQTELAGQAEYNTALGVAFAAEAALKAPCAVPTSQDPGKGLLGVRQGWSELTAAQATVRRIESVQGEKNPVTFKFDSLATPFDGSATAYANCQKVLNALQ